MIRRLVVPLALAVALAACGGSDSKNLSLSTRVVAPAAGALTVAGRVEIQRVRMVVRDIKVRKELAAVEVELERGPFLLDLQGGALSGGVVQQFAVDVPEDTYDELRFVVHKLEDGQTIGDPILDTRQASIVVNLTVDGEPAIWQTDVNDEQRINGVFDLRAGANNVTLQIDPSGWFTSGAGDFLDPRLGAHQQAIEENIRNSIDAFDDDDRDGHSDDGPGHT
jgi:hypothetical protein